MAGELNGHDAAARRRDPDREVREGTVRAAIAQPAAPGMPPPLVVEIGPDGGLVLDGVPADATHACASAPRGRLISANEVHDTLVLSLPEPGGAAAGIARYEVVVDGWRFEVDVEDERRARLRERATSARGDAGRGGPVELHAIIPGRVVSVDVAAGDVVEAGGRLLVVEAMKMQNELRAPRAGTVGSVAVGPGQTVELGDLLMVVE